MMHLFSQNQSSPHSQLLNGVVVATVTNNKDKEELGRVKVKYPWNTEFEEGEGESNWARVVSFMAGDNRGAFFLPDVGDEVLVAFEFGNIESPIVLGSLWNGKDTPPEKNKDGENSIKKIKSKSGHELIFDDTNGAEKITLKDKNGNSIEMDSSHNKITIKSKMELSIEAKVINIKAGTSLTLKSTIVKIN